MSCICRRRRIHPVQSKWILRCKAPIRAPELRALTLPNERVTFKGCPAYSGRYCLPLQGNCLSPAVEANIALRKTALNAVHRQMGAKMVDFGGWDMPVEYS